MKPVFFMGLMGSGKTYWGNKLAGYLGVTFIDLDAWIEMKEGETISEIFEKQGESNFRNLETHYLHDLKKSKDVVIALGGGTPCFNNNIKEITKAGISFYLKEGIEVIVGRLINNNSSRPLIKGKSKIEITAFLEKQLLERESFYMQATYVIEPDKFDEPALLEWTGKRINQDK